MTWLPDAAPGSTPLDRAFGLRPEAYARFREMYAGMWDAAVIDPALLVLCRLRIATILGCEAERVVRYAAAIDVGLDESRIAGLPQWPTSPRFNAAERAAIEFAEQYVVDPHGLTDRQFEALHDGFDEPALATLTLAVAMFDALIRLRLALEVEPISSGAVRVAGPSPTGSLP